MSQTGAGMRVAVIGGGVVGCLTALYLHRLGAKPVVIERGRTGQESSWAGAGILCPIHPWLYPDSLSHFVDYSLNLYPALNRDLYHLTGMSIQWRKSGLMIPLFSDDRVNHQAQAIAWSQQFGWQLDLLNRQQAVAAEPTLSPEVDGALLWPEVGQVRNPRLLQAARKALELSGVEIREMCEVTSLLEAGGRATGLMLADGSSIEADAVLLAAGSWSGMLAEQWGISLPVEPVKGQIVLLKDTPGKLAHIVKHDDAYLVPRVDGHILIGASMERVGFSKGNTEPVVNRLLEATCRMAPGLKDAEIVEQWMGFRPGTPDGLPYLGPVNGRPGLWVATGHYRNGVVLAPGTAELMSRWMMGEEPAVDVTGFRIDRPVYESAAVGFPDR
ncbi:glycine oxidase ThiO [Mariprofundus erugo]|uniref:glycine oxidase ThiO n=1 Tax=Mariprofundus erugo TaxID=2528639 RepID=UPI001EE8F018|nr:glycine oxidase ThiO [Mariprofundus erugo]